MGRKRGAKNGGGGGGGGGEDGLTAAARLSLQVQIGQFWRSEASAELKLPSSLSIEQRAFVHKYALSLGLCTKSRGNGAKRFVTVYKRSQSTIVQKDARISLDSQTKKCISDLLETFPITGREKDELNNCCERERTNHVPMGHLTSAAPQVPSVKYSPEVLSHKKSLPVYTHVEHVMSAMESNQVTVIVGETGSGKTTQIPQIILDRYQRDKKTCRIICTQPRRISAISVAERVAYERGEKVGCSAGYQIRLESRISPKTILTYCTTGVLLRTLMSGGAALATISHIIVDEVHERDKFIDILLISLRDLLTKFKDLKVVLMSATMDATLFSKYFNNCPIVTVPGRVYDVQRIYVDEVLRLTKYKSEAMKKIEKTVERTSKNGKKTKVADGNDAEPSEAVSKIEEIDPEVQSEMNEFLEDSLNEGSHDSFGQLIYMFTTEGVPVNCQHSETGMTSLMIAAYHGMMDMVENLIQMDSDVTITDKEGKNAIDYAVARNHDECADFLRNLQTETIVENKVNDTKTNEGDFLLEVYERSTKSNMSIDYDLILALVKYIHLNLPKGAILIFISGYDDIMYLRNLIQLCGEMRQTTYQLFTLHSNMQPANQKKVFAKCTNSRKIIISTNIAETSITIDDVVYVIDSGKVKENYYESMTGVSSLQRDWISKAQSLQRSGRAGRTQPGKAYLIYSKARFETFQENSLPEILRTSLYELCLHTKLLTAGNVPIADYLAKAIEPPSFTAIKNSITLLKTIGALTPMEDITEIGQHLLSLSIDPKLGKMIMYGCVLKCLDPILTIACTLAYKEPFQLNGESNNSATNCNKKKFAANSLSDHMGLLRAFQAWQVSRSNKTEKKFCRDNLINGATMKMIMGLRTQLVAQLRAIGLVKVRGPGDIKDVNQNSEKWYVVKAALLSGLYPSVARIDRDNFTLRTSKEVKLSFHPSSTLLISRNKTGFINSLKSVPSDWVIYEELVRLGRSCFIRCNTAVTALTVALFGGPLRLVPTALKANLPGLSDDSDSEQDEEMDTPHVETSSLSIDDWIVFTANQEDAFLVYLLRQKFSALMIRRMLHPAKVTSQMDEKIIATIVQVLGLEERMAGLSQPTGIGQKPKPLTPDSHMSRSRNNDFEPMYGFDNRRNYNKTNYNNSQNNIHMNHFSGKQNKNHPAGFNIGNQAPLFQNFMTKSPSSPSGSNLLLASIEKYTNMNGQASNSALPIIRYFVIKVKDPYSIELSQHLGVWNYSGSTEKKLVKACQAGHRVILFFSIGDEISKFFGCAKFLNSSCKNESPAMYHLKWISSQQIPHHHTRHLTNSLNDNKRVFMSKDGQEICAESGRALLSLMEHPPKTQKFRNNGRLNQKH